VDDLLKYKDYVVVAVIVLFSVFFAKNMESSLKTNIIILKRAYNEIEEKKSFLGKIENANKAVEKSKSKLMEGGSFFLTRRVEEFAIDSDVKIISLKPTIKEESDIYEIIAVDLSVECSYSQLLIFLNMCEKKSKIKIEFVKFGGSEDSYTMKIKGVSKK